MLSCLGRVWYLRGKQEKSLLGLRNALEYSRSAMEAAPDQIHMQFNVAFIQTQISSTIYSLAENARTVVDIEAAMAGLEEAIETLSQIAKAPNPPFPRHDIEQRANMSRNTIRKQLERVLQSQREYEEKNASKLEEARKAREAEKSKREEAKRALAQQEEERRQKLREEREKMMEEDRRIADQKAEDDRVRAEAELTTDEETGEKRKREKKKSSKRKKKGDDSEIETGESELEEAERKIQRGRDGSGSPASDKDGAERPQKKKRRKLERKQKNSSKFKSAEKIVDSDSEAGDDDFAGNGNGAGSDAGDASDADVDMQDSNDGTEQAVQRRRTKPTRVLDEDDDDE